ncbi:hypothetical protein M407DRAFT_196371 [Tulasnella calospora MUT 4182]|uniref:Uncharacterized protein n=1 Tax=Tulasnella calospora MUT 4182 TaxID=1051891 RepID=A0A0C3QIY1_9AGAM|nr:hypothetical protein M407DRAFT_196371 [Tulasnella calospora MUT 4182]
MDDISFSGTDGLEAEKFIRAVRKVAFSQGKIEDPRWMAQFASICLEGNALRWHTTLDNETKNDWALFESALLKQYPEEPRYERASSREPPSAISDSIPTPAAAPPSSSSPPAPSAPPKVVSFGSSATDRAIPRTLSANPVKGLIRVESGGPSSAQGYLSRMPDRVGRHIITKSKDSMALQVQYHPSFLPINLKLLNSTTRFSHLTGMWYGNNIVLRPGSTNYMNIVAGDGNDTSFTQVGGQGPSNTAVWLVEATGQIKAVWRNEAGSGSETDPCCEIRDLSSR